MTCESYVYLLESECGRIKIGNSCRPHDRLRVFSNVAPRPVRLIAMWPGSQSDEKQLHTRFRACRTHNEWFRPEGAFALFVEEKRGLGVQEIPAWESLSWTCVSTRTRARKSEKSRATRADPAWKAQQAAARAWRKTVEAHEASIGRAMSWDERRRFYDEHHPSSSLSQVCA